MLLTKIDKRLIEIYEEHKKDSEDITGWHLLQKLKKEAKYHIFLYYFLVYRLFEVVYQRGEIIKYQHMIKELLRCPYHTEQFVPKERGSANEDEVEIFPGIIFTKGITTRILEGLGLHNTLKSFLYHLMIKEEEINEKRYLSEEEVSNFSDIENIIEIFLEEYQKLKI